MKNLIIFSNNQAVSHHNNCTDAYFFGNSIVGASANSQGNWTFLIGPDYTSPNYLNSEELYLVINGNFTPLKFCMHRIRKSGVFFGTALADGIKAYVWDFAPPNMPLAVRYIYVDTKLDDLQVAAKITSFESDDAVTDSAVTIKKDTTRYCFGNRETLNWDERCCSIYFNRNSTCETKDDAYYITAPLINGTAALLHNFAYGEPAEINIDAKDLLNKTFKYWQDWFNDGCMPKIQNQRDSDAVESLLLSVKMQQNRDGGSIAGIRKYANSYVRDTHGGMRMFIATGHFAEVKLLLENIHSRFEIAGFIPNWWSMGSDTFIGHSFFNDASEVTAYYMFMARDYLKHTGDTKLIQKIMPSIKWAAETQLNWLKEHDYTIPFNGDETEQYCCNNDGEEYGTFVVPEYSWDHLALSFPSAVAALCSLEWYCEITGIDYSDDIKKIRDKIDEVFLKDNGIHTWSAKITEEGIRHHRGTLTNYLLLPLWMRATLNNNAHITDAAHTKNLVSKNGFLPNCIEVMPGFCGHTMGLYLYCMLKLGDTAEANRAARQILDTNLLSMYGTVAEFYGPNCVPNGHMCRAFEGGIVGEALIEYFKSLNA